MGSKVTRARGYLKEPEDADGACDDEHEGDDVNRAMKLAVQGRQHETLHDVRHAHPDDHDTQPVPRVLQVHALLYYHLSTRHVMVSIQYYTL